MWGGGWGVRDLCCVTRDALPHLRRLDIGVASVLHASWGTRFVMLMMMVMMMCERQLLTCRMQEMLQGNGSGGRGRGRVGGGGGLFKGIRSRFSSS